MTAALVWGLGEVWPACAQAGYVHKSRRDNVVHMWVKLRDDVCCGCKCYKWGIVVMDVIWRRLCVGMF